MKKCRLLVLVLLVLLVPGVSFAASACLKPINIFSGVTILKGGTSTYVVNVSKCNPPLRGNYTFQFSSVTPVGAGEETVSGATINLAYRISNRLPSGTGVGVGLLTGVSVITSNLEGADIVTGLAHDSGNTEYTYGFWPTDNPGYVILDATAGVTDMIISGKMDMK